MYDKALKTKSKIISVAPMMDWTDDACRTFHRILTQQSLLYTEMIVADAIIHGDTKRHLAFASAQHPVALQLGGSEPAKLAQAIELAEPYKYDEYNLNVGCPSDRVQSGTFGACLMREPELVGRCVRAMKDATDRPVTVKCRLGVDEQNTVAALNELTDSIVQSDVDAIWVHARKAWLQGLSPKDNREIPPLDYERVYQLKSENPDVFIGINGGISSLDEACKHLQHVDGVMMGRAAYHDPALLLDVDHRFYGQPHRAITRHTAVRQFYPYVEAHLSKGGRLMQVCRHILGIFHGCPGARRFRQILSTDGVRPNAGLNVLEHALECVPENNAKLRESAA